MEIIFQHDAASHYSCEFSIVHDIAARVGGEGLFHDFFFEIQPMPAANPVRVAASMIVFTSLLSDMFDILKKLFFQFMIFSQSSSGESCSLQSSSSESISSISSF